MSSVPPCRVFSIDHVTLVTADMAASRRFYVDLLGMVPVERPAFNFPGLWFQAGNTQIHLIAAHDLSDRTGQRAPLATAATGRVFHFAFEVADCVAALAALKAAGVVARGGPSTRPDGCLQVWVYDPDDHVVELFSRPQATDTN